MEHQRVVHVDVHTSKSTRYITGLSCISMVEVFPYATQTCPSHNTHRLATVSEPVPAALLSVMNCRCIGSCIPGPQVLIEARGSFAEVGPLLWQVLARPSSLQLVSWARTYTAVWRHGVCWWIGRELTCTDWMWQHQPHACRSRSGELLSLHHTLWQLSANMAVARVPPILH